MSDKVTVDISPIANSITVAPITTSVEIVNNTTAVELTSVTYENNITQSVTNVDITPTTTTVEATVNTTTVDISPNTTTVGVGDASIVASNLASATNTSHDSNSWITGGNVQASFDNLATTADSRYVNVTGDTMTGDLVVDTKVESPLFKGDLEGAVHFKASGSGLAKGDVVYITGYQGNRTTVDKADASDSAKMPAFGIVNATQGGNVDVLTFGSMLHLSTTGIATGTELYVSATTPGGYETSAPTGEGNLVQKIAKVVRGDSNSGSIKIMGAGRTNATPNLNDGNIFIGNSSNIPTTASFDTTFGSSFGTRSTSDLSEGTNLYYTDAKVDARISNAIKDEDNMASNSATHVPSQQSVKAYVDAEVAGLVNGAPDDLNTLHELADALAEDANFSATVTTSIGNKLAKASNLSDLTNAATARTNLGLGTAATTASTDYATAAQGSKADTAYGWGNHADAGYGTSNLTIGSGENQAMAGNTSLVTSIGGLSDVDITTTAPTNNQVLVWSTDKFVPADQSGSGGGVDLTAFSVGENATASGSGGIGYNNTSGVFTYTPPVLSNFLTSETSHEDVLVDGDFTDNGFMKRTGAGTYTVDTNTYLTSVSAEVNLRVENESPLAFANISYNSGLNTTVFQTTSPHSLGIYTHVRIIDSSGDVTEGLYTPDDITINAAYVFSIDGNLGTPSSVSTVTYNRESPFNPILKISDSEGNASNIQFTSEGGATIKRATSSSITIDSAYNNDSVADYMQGNPKNYYGDDDDKTMLWLSGGQVQESGNTFFRTAKIDGGGILTYRELVGGVSGLTAGFPFNINGVQFSPEPNFGIGKSDNIHISFSDPITSSLHPTEGTAFPVRTFLTGNIISTESTQTTSSTESNPLSSVILGQDNVHRGENNAMFNRDNMIDAQNKENIVGGYGNSTRTVGGIGTNGNDRNIITGTENHIVGGVQNSFTCGEENTYKSTSWSFLGGKYNYAFESNSIVMGGEEVICNASHQSINVGEGDSNLIPEGGMTNTTFNGSHDGVQAVYANISISAAMTQHVGVNAKVHVTVNSSGDVTNISVVDQGSGFRIGEAVTLPAGTLGSGSSAFTFYVKSISPTLNKNRNLYSYTAAQNTAVFGKCNAIGYGGEGSAIFGEQNLIGGTASNTQIPTDSTYGAPFTHIPYGFNEKPEREAKRSMVVGYKNRIGEGNNSFISGDHNEIEANNSFVAGRLNSVGVAGGNHTQMLLGLGLDSPQHSGNVNIGDGQVVVGAYNDKSTFDSALRSTHAGGWTTASQHFSVGTGANHLNRKTSFVIVPRQTSTANNTTRDFCGIAMPALADSASYSSDYNAFLGGVPIGGLYRNGNTVKIRMT